MVFFKKIIRNIRVSVDFLSLSLVSLSERFCFSGLLWDSLPTQHKMACCSDRWKCDFYSVKEKRR